MGSQIFLQRSAGSLLGCHKCLKSKRRCFGILFARYFTRPTMGPGAREEKLMDAILICIGRIIHKLKVRSMSYASLAAVSFFSVPSSAAVLNISGTEIAFGQVEVGESTSRHIVASYSLAGGEMLVGLELFIVGLHSTDYSFGAPTCAPAPTLCEFDLVFAPTAAGTRSATLGAYLILEEDGLSDIVLRSLTGVGCIDGTGTAFSCNRPVQPIAEPGVLALFLPALSVLAGLRRRQTINSDRSGK